MTEQMVVRTAAAAWEPAVRQAIEDALAARTAVDLSWLGLVDLTSVWALSPGTLGFLSTLVVSLKPRHVLELGSGASTRVLARAASRLDPPALVTSVDHDPEFTASTKRMIDADGTAHVVRLQVAPLVARKRFGALVPVYDWDRGAFASRKPADLVLIDGPPGVLGGRRGTLYQALEVSRAGTVILLDDANRKKESMALEQWTRELGDAIDVRRLPGLERGMAAVLACNLSGLASRMFENGPLPPPA